MESDKDTIQRLLAEIQRLGELASRVSNNQHSQGKGTGQGTTPNGHEKSQEATGAAVGIGRMLPATEGRGKRSPDQDDLGRPIKCCGCSFKPINVFDVPSDDDILSLNIGGNHLDVCRGTLTCLPSLLAAKYSGEWDESQLRDSNGRFFVDEEPELFAALVNYLRDCNRMLPSNGLFYAIPPSFHDTDKQLRWERLLESIHLQPVLPFQWMKKNAAGLALLDGSIQSKITHQSGDDTEGLTEYVVQRRASDSRHIVSFDVQVHISEGAGLHIGWLEYSLDTVTVDMIVNNPYIYLSLPDGRLHSVVHGVDAFPDIDRRINIPTKTDYKVRCSNRGAEWYIDDELVAETIVQSQLFSGLQPCFYTYDSNVNFQLVHVEYEEDE